MKRPVISERMFLYWTDREHPNTCRMTVRMQDAIELTMMQKSQGTGTLISFHLPLSNPTAICAR